MIIYSDMDGVIADFFGGLCEVYNSQYRPPSFERIRHWKAIPNLSEVLESLKGTDFFYTLDTFDNVTYDLIGYLKELESKHTWIEMGILTTPLKNDYDNSSYHKRRWLERYNLMPKDVSNLIFSDAKYEYAINKIDGTPNILIDDKPSNIQQWKDAGGIGLQFQANQNSWVKLQRNLIEVL